MPLSTPAPRKLLHTRTVECFGYERDDGLWDVEGHMTDVKTYSFANRDRGGEIRAGEPVHGMWLRITIDTDMRIHAAEASTDYSPFAICPEIAGAYRRLVGLRIGRGWNRRLKELFGGVAGCTHLTELLGPMATTAYQTLYKVREKKAEELQKLDAPPPILGTCHAFAPSSSVVQWLFPKFHRPRDAAVAVEE